MKNIIITAVLFSSLTVNFMTYAPTCQSRDNLALADARDDFGKLTARVNPIDLKD